MNIFCEFDANGEPLGFWNTDVHSEIPRDAVQITEEQWLALIDQSAGRKRLVNGVVELVPVMPPTPLQVIQGLERDNPITHRSLRELILTLGELNPAGKATLLYKRVLAVEMQIAAERAKL